MNNNQVAEFIHRRRRQILIHSCLYYRLNKNIISDTTFDLWCRELVEVQNDYPYISKKIIYSEAFKDFDGSTGMHLPLGDSWIRSKAIQLLNNPEVKKMRNIHN